MMKEFLSQDDCLKFKLSMPELYSYFHSMFYEFGDSTSAFSRRHRKFLGFLKIDTDQSISFENHKFLAVYQFYQPYDPIFELHKNAMINPWIIVFSNGPGIFHHKRFANKMLMKKWWNNFDGFNT